MPTQRARHRAKAFAAQQGRCFYCELPLCACDPKDFAERHRLTVPLARQLISTAEHLTARSEGGPDSAANIAAAHAICNQRRHRYGRSPSPEQHRRRALTRVARGGWHDPRVLKAFRKTVFAEKG
jgi:5-methylcytosine-specific restriction endonuclease McrA